MCLKFIISCVILYSMLTHVNSSEQKIDNTVSKNDSRKHPVSPTPAKPKQINYRVRQLGRPPFNRVHPNSKGNKGSHPNRPTPVRPEANINSISQPDRPPHNRDHLNSEDDKSHPNGPTLSRPEANMNNPKRRKCKSPINILEDKSGSSQPMKIFDVSKSGGLAKQPITASSENNPEKRQKIYRVPNQLRLGEQLQIEHNMQIINQVMKNKFNPQKKRKQGDDGIVLNQENNNIVLNHVDNNKQISIINRNSVKIARTANSSIPESSSKLENSLNVAVGSSLNEDRKATDDELVENILEMKDVDWDNLWNEN